MKIKDIVAMMAVIVTAGGCTSNDEGTQPGEAVPIRLATTIAPANTRGTTVSTRAAGDWGERTTTQDTELLEGQTVRAWVSENDGSHTAAIKNPIEYTVSNATGDLEPVSDTTPFYYPVGVNTISIHAIHPSGYDSGEKFTVNLDQTTEANYAASDLCYSQPADFTRSDVDANGRKLLQMKHLLSKIVVNLTLDENVTGATLPQAIKLHAMTSTVMTYPVDVATDANGYTGCTVSDASDLGAITMKQEAIIPPQTIAAGVSFITFNVDGLGPMLYPLPAATTFESGKRYTYNIRVKNVGLAVTTSVNDWGTKVANQNLIGKLRDIKKNPLWYVAEYNMNDAAGTTMSNSANVCYYYTRDEALAKFGAQTTPYSNYAVANKTITNDPSGSKWHLPGASEWFSIVPSGNIDGGIVSLDDGSGTYYSSSEENVVFGYDAYTKAGFSEASYWKKGSGSLIYAIRFLGTEYCSAWKYEFLGGWAASDLGYLRVSATLIGTVDNSSLAASAWFNAHSWDGSGANAITFGNDETKLAVQRDFYALGVGVGENTNYGFRGYYWSTTVHPTNSNTNRYFFMFKKNGAFAAYVNNPDAALTNTVRLFRDN